MAQKEAIMRAIMEAMGSSAPMTSKRPKARPMSDADRMRQRRMDRAGMLEALEAGEMGQMSDADLARLRKKLGMMDGGKVMKYESGGAVRGNKKKPKMGCVMNGRGGTYKGQR
jgi:hypothetical protein